MNRRALSLALALGLLGGLVLGLSHAFFTPGKLILLPWAAVVLGTVVAIRAEVIEPFALRFSVGVKSHPNVPPCSHRNLPPSRCDVRTGPTGSSPDSSLFSASLQ